MILEGLLGQVGVVFLEKEPLFMVGKVESVTLTSQCVTRCNIQNIC